MSNIEQGILNVEVRLLRRYAPRNDPIRVDLRLRHSGTGDTIGNRAGRGLPGEIAVVMSVEEAEELKTKSVKP